MTEYDILATAGQQVEPFSYDTTTEMHDDLGTFDPSPRD